MMDKKVSIGITLIGSGFTILVIAFLSKLIFGSEDINISILIFSFIIVGFVTFILGIRTTKQKWGEF